MIRVGVLMGGIGIEHEVSFNSGRTICQHLDMSTYQVIPIFQTMSNQLYIIPWKFLCRGKTTDFVHRLPTEAECVGWQQLAERIDIAYIAMHGRYAEDGTLQGVCELLGIAYVGSKLLPSALGMHKRLQKSFLQMAGIPVAKDMCLSAVDTIDNATRIDEIIDQLQAAQIDVPYVVKPVGEGSSLGISVVEHTDQLAAAISTAALIDPGRVQEVLIEEFIVGMEFSCIVIYDHMTRQLRALPPTEIECEVGTKVYDYEQKYMPGRSRKYTPARVSQDVIAAIQQMAVRVMHVLGFKTIGRIDGFVTADGTVYINDPNSFCGTAPSSFFFKQAAEINLNHTQIINHILESELAQTEQLPFDEQDGGADVMAPVPIEKKIRVAVLLGGDSHEREISLESGRNIVYKLSPHKYEVTPVFVDMACNLYLLDNKLLVCNATAEIAGLISDDMRIEWDQMPEQFDFVFIGLHGGRGENGSVQAMLEMLGMPYNGSGILTSALCMDKYKTNQLLRQHGFHVPLAVYVTLEDYTHSQGFADQMARSGIELPCIVKPHNDGCSIGVYKVDTAEQLYTALQMVSAQTAAGGLVEQLVTGMELTVGVYGNDTITVLPPSYAVAGQAVLSIEEKFLPGAGENQTPAPIDADAHALVEETIGAVYRQLGCKGYARIDCFYQVASVAHGPARVVILEVNTLPAMTPATCIFHQAAERGITPMEFIDMIVQYGFDAHPPRMVPPQESEAAVMNKN